MEEQNNLRTLLSKYAGNTATEEEQQQLFSLITATADEELEGSLTTILETTQPFYDEARRQRILSKLLEQIGREERNEYAKNATIIPIYRRNVFKWIAAASIIFLLGISIYVILSTGRRPASEAHEGRLAHDVPAPTNTRAVITLADGSKVYLDSANNGTIATDNNVNVLKNENGEIIYSPDHQITKSPDHSISYNTMFNPRGSKVISLTLSDGTRVWLNSESSLKYPIAFGGNTREVEITGEAYFEVQHNSKQPFKVHLPNGSVIEDIGTAFNVNAYTDEAGIKTTLIEGSVRVSNGSPDHQITKSQILKPGEQLVQSPDHQITRSPDIDEVLAWKNGRFQFSESSIEDILKEVSRYYDAEIVYADNIPGHFVADISRDVPVSKLLRILELTNRVHFKIEGKKITVTK